jgi:hypothetical protein
LNDGFLRASSEVNGDSIDNRRQWNGKAARGERRHGQEDKRPENEELLPAAGQLRVDQAGPRLKGCGALPQQLDTPSRRPAATDTPFWG